MRVSEIGRMKCPVARTLSIVGDPWTLLIMRELFLGSRRFAEFQGYTGMSPALLSDRLKLLREEGIVTRGQPRGQRRDGSSRNEYRLTEKGLDLYPVILALSQWGSRWMCAEEEPFLELVHRTCGSRTAPHLACSECGEPIAPRDVEAHILPTMRDDRRRARAEFQERIRGS